MVTILFADLVGSTPLGEMLDPEAVHDLVISAQAALAATVSHFEGHVAKYLGDGLMVLFGAPIAHEDDAERAVLAGLEMHDVLVAISRTHPSTIPALQLRVGITSGEVIAGAIAGTYDVIGDAANTAARLQAAAPVGGVLAGEETMRLAERRIRFGGRQELRLKGKAEVVSAYPALGLRERVAERWEIRQRTPLVGREQELGLLMEAWERARAHQGQLITVVGEAGVGKSRLVAEALERIERQELRSVKGATLHGRCLSYSQQVSLSLIANLMRTLCSVHEHDEQDQVHSRLSRTVDDLLTDQDENTRAAAIDVLAELLGLPATLRLGYSMAAPAGVSPVAGATAQIRRQVLVRSLRLLFEALCTRSRVVLTVEDLHWVDPASSEVLAELMKGVPPLRLLVLATHRPGWSAPWRQWDWVQLLELAPLDEQQAIELAGAVLERRPLAAELERYLVERAGGNPFFVEELLRSLQEAGDLSQQDGVLRLAEGAAERLPSTLTEVLLARMDRLEREVRRVAQIASVIGRDFAVRLLAQVVGREAAALEIPLAVLHRAEIAFPWDDAGDRRYVFKHATIRDVAYQTLLLGRRRALHAAIARAIAQLYPVEEHIETIAYHYARTEEHQEAGRWLERAGDRAAQVYANEVALAHYAQAREHLQQVEATAPELARLDEKQGSVLATLGRCDEALALLERAAGVYRNDRDLEAEARVVARIGTVHREGMTPKEGIARIQAVLASLQGEPGDKWPSWSLAQLYTSLAYLYEAAGMFQEQLEGAERASELARAVGDNQVLARAETMRGIALQHLGRGKEGLQAMEQVMPLTEAAGDLETLWEMLLSVGVRYMLNGILNRGRTYLARGVEVAERMDSPGRIQYALAFLGHCLFCLGAWTEARQHLERAIEVGRSTGSSWYSGPLLMILGNLYMATGNLEEACRCLQEAVVLGERSRDLTVLPIAHGLLVEIALLEGSSAPALQHLEQLASEPGSAVAYMLPIFAWALLERGDIAGAEKVVKAAIARASGHDQVALVDALRVQGMVQSRQEKWSEAQRCFREAAALARSMPYPYAEARALYEEGMMYARKREPGLARERLSEALATFQRLGAGHYVKRTQRALAEQVQL